MEDVVLKFWQKIYPDVDFTQTNEKGYVLVKCKWHNDNTASAYINPLDGFYGCFACSLSLQFKDFLGRYYNSDNQKFIDSIINAIDKTECNEWTQNQNNLLNNPHKYQELINMGFHPHVIKECQLGLEHNETFAIPVYMYDVYFGCKFYNKNPIAGYKKSWSSKGLKNGLIIPFNLFIKSNEPVLLCAGEKDMLIARSKGFNAITLTGGEQASIKYWLEYFKNRETYIVYDNDDTGRKGAIKIAKELFKNGCRVKNVTNFHIGMLDKEDIYDYFMKYNHSTNDLVACINATNYVSEQDIIEWSKLEHNYVNFIQLVSPYNIKKECLTSVQIRAAYEAKYTIPKKVKVKKYCNANDALTQNTLELAKKDDGTYGNWCTEEIEYEFDLLENDYMFYLMQDTAIRDKWIHNLVQPKIIKSSKKILNGDIIILETKTIHHYLIGEYVGQDVSNNETKVNDMLEYEMFSFESFLPSTNHQMILKPIGQPLDDNKIVMIMIAVTSQNSDVENYKLTINGINLLRQFQTNGISIEQKLHELHKRARSFIKPHTSFNLWLTQELVFLSPLFINWDNKRTRGVLHTLIIGDTRTGKSECATAMIKKYQQGKIVSAKQATESSLIGGTDGTGKKQYTKAGVIPRNNKGLVVLEEIHGLQSYFNTITDIKSSGIVRINRVAGELTLEANVRILEIANPVTNSKQITSVSASASGFSLIEQLIGRPEDIARNDMYLIIKQVDTFTYNINPNEVYEPFSDESYKERIKWAWKLTEKDIVFINPQYIIQCANYLNNKFYTPGIDILGAEAPEKLARLSASLAVILCNFNENNIVIVDDNIVAFITQWLDQLYCAPYFALDKVVHKEKEFKEVNQNDLIVFKEINEKTGYQTIIEHLQTIDTISLNEIDALLNNGKGATSAFVSQMTNAKLLRSVGFNQYKPTEKFRNITKGVR